MLLVWHFGLKIGFKLHFSLLTCEQATSGRLLTITVCLRKSALNHHQISLLVVVVVIIVVAAFVRAF